MAEIVPAILPKDFKEIAEKVPQIVGAVPSVQIDFCDGVLVPNKTWPYVDVNEPYWKKITEESEGFPEWQKMDYEFDLMIANPKEKFEEFARLGPARMILHFGSFVNTEELKSFLAGIEEFWKEKIQIGLAVPFNFEAERLEDLIGLISFVQVMGIEKIGFQGQSFSDKAVETVRNLHNKYPDLFISVDGGVNLENSPRLIEAGAKRLAVGSALWKTDDVQETLEKFKNLA